MGIRVSINERTKADTPEKKDDGNLPWILAPSKPPEKKCPDKKPGNPSPCGPQKPPAHNCPPPPPPQHGSGPGPSKPVETLSPVRVTPDNEIYEKILKALEKEHKLHFIYDVYTLSQWIYNENDEYYYFTIKSTEHNIVHPVVKEVFVKTENGYENALYAYKVLDNKDIQIISSEPMEYKVYIESEE